MNEKIMVKLENLLNYDDKKYLEIESVNINTQ